MGDGAAAVEHDVGDGRLDLTPLITHQAWVRAPVECEVQGGTVGQARLNRHDAVPSRSVASQMASWVAARTFT